KIERVENTLIAPSVAAQFAIQHFPQQSGAAAGRVFFLPRHHVTGTHRTVFMTATLPHPHAALDRVRKTPLVGRKAEMRVPLRRLVMLAISKIVVAMARPDDLPRIHLPVRVPKIG